LLFLLLFFPPACRRASYHCVRPGVALVNPHFPFLQGSKEVVPFPPFPSSLLATASTGPNHGFRRRAIYPPFFKGIFSPFFLFFSGLQTLCHEVHHLPLPLFDGRKDRPPSAIKSEDFDSVGRRRGRRALSCLPSFF